MVHSICNYLWPVNRWIHMYHECICIYVLYVCMCMYICMINSHKYKWNAVFTSYHRNSNDSNILPQQIFFWYVCMFVLCIALVCIPSVRENSVFILYTYDQCTHIIIPCMWQPVCELLYHFRFVGWLLLL